MYGRQENHTEFWGRNRFERGHKEGRNENGKIILTWILGKSVVSKADGLNSFKAVSTGGYEHSNSTYSVLLFLQVDQCSCVYTGLKMYERRYIFKNVTLHIIQGPTFNDVLFSNIKDVMIAML
jgi:hypothetical protein